MRLVLGVLFGLGIGLAEPALSQSDPTSAVWRLWEYQRAEFNRIIRLSETQKTAYRSKIGAAGKQRNDIALLLALNCALPPGDFGLSPLQEYRCRSLPFHELLRWITISGGDVYVLSFAKTKDIKEAVAFLRDYMQLLKRHGLPLDGADGEYFLELIDYLESGGFN
jgi:hypothetical protein